MARNRDKYRHGETLKRVKLDRAIEETIARILEEIAVIVEWEELGLSC